MTVSASLENRLQQLGDTINYRHARTIVIGVPTELTPIEGEVEMISTVSPETRAAAVDEILDAIGVGEQDTVIEIARYTIDGPPELISVT